MMPPYNVTGKGGNQYLVTNGDESETVCLDGLTIMSDAEYEEIEAAGLLDDYMECPSSAKASGLWSEAELAAIHYAANYSGFTAREYIANTPAL